VLGLYLKVSYFEATSQGCGIAAERDSFLSGRQDIGKEAPEDTAYIECTARY
jgi:hypothetical protein